MCSFDGPWFGASYPDAVCLDGYLHDADADGYDTNDVTHPCPRCNTREFLKVAKEDADGTEYMSVAACGFFDEMTGEKMWGRAKQWARQENPAEAEALIVETDRRKGEK